MGKPSTLSRDIPNTITLAAMKEAEEMERYPERYKSYNSMDELMKDLDAWDPDYTKLTSEEKRSVEAAENSGFVNDSDIDWSKIGH